MNTTNDRAKFASEDSDLTSNDLDMLLDDEEFAIKEFDAADYLNSPEAIAAYLTEMLRDGDESMVAAALGAVSRAVGMGTIAERAGIGREALYKALRANSSPRLSTVNNVCRALGMRMVIQIEPATGGHVQPLKDG